MNFLDRIKFVFNPQGTLNDLYKRLELLETKMETPKKLAKPEADPTIHDYNRLQMLLKFENLRGKAIEIEAEWRKIQQEAHDTDFYNQVFLGKKETEVAHKDGFVKGIQWCIEKFS